MDEHMLSEMLATGRELLDNGEGIDTNPEYARGIAEFIVETVPHLNQERHKDAVLALLDTRPA